VRRRLSRPEAYNLAEKVVDEIGFISLPIDPFLIAKRKDIMCEAENLDGCSGCLCKSGDVFGILYPSSGNEGFKRFTIAHELGHYFLPGHPELLFPQGNGVHQSQSDFISSDQHEREADWFAAGLLMPTEMFRRAIRHEKKEGLAAIESLTATCQTSLTATAIRFSECSSEPVAIICSSGDRVDWCFLSDAMRQVKGLNPLKKGEILSPQSTTYLFNQNISNIQKNKHLEDEAYLDYWFAGAPSVKVNEDIIGLGRYGKTLTVLFTGSLSEEDDEDSEWLE
jgi:Zn-dependent peptidase ImmA (M78 family)